LTNNNLFYIGKLGKPHSLKGFQYINIEIFFRSQNLNNIELRVGNENLIVDKFKSHLKDRNLIKFVNFDSIESIQGLRDADVYLSKKFIDKFIDENNLPWPGFFKGSEITPDGKVFSSFQYLNKMIFCNVKGIDDFPIPYNGNFFKFKNGNLELIDEDLTTQPFKN
jgi:hypothetical protein|tara:strand:- start:5770 stop:6267 length:498 start_codon:yes stop_codon:yes gene_type:complete